MKKIFLRFLLSALIVGGVACSDDFLHDNINPVRYPAGDSDIQLAPEWGTVDGHIYLPDAGNVEFEIRSTPGWLKVESTTGHLFGGFATLRCSAVKDDGFEYPGIFIDRIIVEAGGVEYAVPVSYVNEGNPQIEVEATPFDYQYQSYFSVVVRNTGEGLLIWDIVSMPGWLDTVDFDVSRQMISSYEGTEIPLTLRYDPTQPSEVLTGKIVIASNDKNNPEITVPVSASIGSSSVSFYSDLKLDFGTSQTTLYLDVRSSGPGYLLWSIEDAPEWLIPDAKGGMLGWYSEPLTFTCNRSLLSDGYNAATIHLLTSDPGNPSIAIQVSARKGDENSANVYPVEGKINDAWMDKSTGLMYLAMETPNEVVVYDINARVTVRTIPLSLAPTCLAVSEDATVAAVGHSGMISYINLNNDQVKEFEVEKTVNDIEIGLNNWLAYSDTNGITGWNSMLQWLNVNTGERENDGTAAYGVFCIRKVPGQNYLLVSDTELDPLYVYDMAARKQKAELWINFHLFWWLKGGDYVTDQSGNIYSTADITASEGNSNISPTGTIPLEKVYDGIHGLDYCEATNSIFYVQADTWNEPITSVYQIDGDRLTPINVYQYDHLYYFSEKVYQVEADFIFANASGTELIVVRNTTDGVFAGSLEFIEVK